MNISSQPSAPTPTRTPGLRIEPLTATFGARVLGVNLHADIDDDMHADITRLWHKYKVLVFPNQHTPRESDLVGFSRRLGDLEIHVRREYLSPENPELLYVSNVKRGGKPIGILADTEVGWHYDQIYLKKPAVGSLLCAVTVPPHEGHTYFADMVTAYRTLPADVRMQIDGRVAVQSYEAFNRMYSVPTNKEQKRKTPETDHPVVRTHPHTGESALYICPGMTTKICGLEERESEELLKMLFDWSVKDEFVYRHEWRTGDCVLWDNACTMHRRDPFDSRYDRLMKRTTILPPAELAVPFYAPD